MCLTDSLRLIRTVGRAACRLSHQTVACWDVSLWPWLCDELVVISSTGLFVCLFFRGFWGIWFWGIIVGVFDVHGMFLESTWRINVQPQEFSRKWRKCWEVPIRWNKVNTPIEYADGLDESCRTLWLLDNCAQRTGEPITDTYSTFWLICGLLSSCILPRGVSSGGAAMIRFEVLYIRDVLLLCSYRVHNRGAEVIGRYGIYVKTVLLILFEGFTSILTFVGFSPSRSYCLAIV